MKLRTLKLVVCDKMGQPMIWRQRDITMSFPVTVAGEACGVRKRELKRRSGAG
jgi:hypothetical protein